MKSRFNPASAIAAVAGAMLLALSGITTAHENHTGKFGTADGDYPILRALSQNPSATETRQRRYTQCFRKSVKEAGGYVFPGPWRYTKRDGTVRRNGYGIPLMISGDSQYGGLKPIVYIHGTSRQPIGGAPTSKIEARTNGYGSTWVKVISSNAGGTGPEESGCATAITTSGGSGNPKRHCTVSVGDTRPPNVANTWKLDDVYRYYYLDLSEIDPTSSSCHAEEPTVEEPVVDTTAAVVTVADATFQEPSGTARAYGWFMLRLNKRIEHATVVVNFAIEGVTATEGDDYEIAGGPSPQRMRAGSRSRAIPIRILADDIDDSGETLRLTISSVTLEPEEGQTPSIPSVTIGNAQGVITITNEGTIPKAYTSRLGSAVATQIVDAVRDRLARSGPGETHEMNANVWARIAATDFDSEEGGVAVDASVNTTMLGADANIRDWTIGTVAARSHSTASYHGTSYRATDYRPVGSGTMKADLMGLYPYVNKQIGRFDIWGTAGHGEGELTVTPDDRDSIKSDLDMTLVAAGIRGTVIKAPDSGGLELTTNTDATIVWVDAGRGRSSGWKGTFAATETKTEQLRFGLEGTWHGLTAGLSRLTPSLKTQLRHDSGDGDQGLGLEIGGNLAWAHDPLGLQATIGAKTLIMHEDDAVRNESVYGDLSWRPLQNAEGSSLGPQLTMGYSKGAVNDDIFGEAFLSKAGAESDTAQNLGLKLGYGLPMLGRFVSIPEVGIHTSEYAQTTTLGWRMKPATARDGASELSIEYERAVGFTVDHDVRLRWRTSW